MPDEIPGLEGLLAERGYPEQGVEEFAVGDDIFKDSLDREGQAVERQRAGEVGPGEGQALGGLARVDELVVDADVVVLPGRGEGDGGGRAGGGEGRPLVDERLPVEPQPHPLRRAAAVQRDGEGVLVGAAGDDEARPARAERPEGQAPGVRPVRRAAERPVEPRVLDRRLDRAAAPRPVRPGGD